MKKSDQEIKRMLSEIKAYISKYNQTIDCCVPQEVIDNFKEEWKSLTKYVVDRDDPFDSNKTMIGDSLYGFALNLYAVAYYRLGEDLQLENLKKLEHLILAFEKDKDVKYLFARKSFLFYELGRCWHTVCRDDYAKKYFKNYIYYSLYGFNIKYNTTAYAFRRCSTFVYQSLINEQLNVSSPSTFNDPYDCPVIELLNNGDEISQLIREACLESIKIACFVKNTKLPHKRNGEIVEKLRSKRRQKKEYLNGLMWAHYADSHKGICIKYRFPNNFSVLTGDNKSILSFFRNVEYNSEKLGKYSQKGGISLKDAFFLKVEDWKYENELRFLHFDLNDSNLYKSIKIPNCIEAIYFGLRCPKVERDTIKKIMQGKQFEEKDINGKVIRREPVKFYQMKVDKNYCGSLVAEKIK